MAMHQHQFLKNRQLKPRGVDVEMKHFKVMRQVKNDQLKIFGDLVIRHRNYDDCGFSKLRKMSLGSRQSSFKAELDQDHPLYLIYN